MSMLTRKGTMIRKNRGSVKRGRRNQSGSGVSTGSLRSTGSGSVKSTSAGVAGIKEEIIAQNSPARSIASTVVSFDDERQLCKTSVEWRNYDSSADQSSHYGSVFLQIKEANKESDDTCDFVCRSGKILCHTAFVTVLVGMSTALPITMISVGVKYLNECPRQRKIPVYLLVGGCFGMLKVIGTVWHNIQSKRYEDLDSFYDSHVGDGAFASRTYKMMDMLLSTFLISWLIAGTYWVFTIWEPNYHQLLYEPSDWCDRTVYLFAAYQILACYGFLCFILLLMLILALCHKYSAIFHSR